jgi:hypothetical protein
MDGVTASLEFRWEPDVANNTSKVTVLLWITNNLSAGATVSPSWSVKINDGRWYPAKYLPSFHMSRKSTVEKKLETLSVSHNEYGEASVEVEVNMEGSFADFKFRETSTYKINRATSLDWMLGDYIPNDITFSFTVKSRTLRNVLYFYLGDESLGYYNIGTRYEGVHNDTIKLDISGLSYTDLYKRITNSNKATFRFVMKTYSSSTEIGESTKELELEIPLNDDTKPQFTTEIEAVSAFNGIYLTGKSGVIITFKEIETKHGATVASKKAIVGGTSYLLDAGEQSVTSDIIVTNGNVSVTGYITDSRGFTTSGDSHTINVIEYYAPRMGSHEGESREIVTRCDESGAITDSGTYLKIKIAKKYAKIIVGEEQKNHCDISYRVKGYGESDYSVWAMLPRSVSDNVEAVLALDLDINYPYSVQLKASDTVGEESIMTFSIPSSTVYLHKAGSRNSLGIGKLVEDDNTVDISEKLNVKVRGRLIVAGEEISVSNGLTANIDDTDVVWRYRTISGITECWGSIPFTGNIVNKVSYPIEFATTPLVICSMQSEHPIYCVSKGPGTASETPTFGIYGEASEYSGVINLYVMGIQK